MKFLRVEPLLIEHIKQFGLPEDGLVRDGFDLEEQAVREILATENSVLFEATGTSIFFPSVLENLGQSYNIKLVRIHCPLDICYQRIEERDQDGQFFVSNEMMKSINERAAKVTFDWDLEIDNSAPASNEDIVSQFSVIHR